MKDRRRKSIKISQELHEYLRSRGKYEETFEDIIWRLIKTKISK